MSNLTIFCPIHGNRIITITIKILNTPEQVKRLETTWSNLFVFPSGTFKIRAFSGVCYLAMKMGRKLKVILN